MLVSGQPWSDWDSRYYSAYLDHFSEYLRDHTPSEAFERFILSSSSNFNPDLAAATVQDVKNAGKEGKRHPEMLNRLLAGLLHPFIHFASGFEFGIPGQAAEGELTLEFSSPFFNSGLYQAWLALLSTAAIRPSLCHPRSFPSFLSLASSLG